MLPQLQADSILNAWVDEIKKATTLHVFFTRVMEPLRRMDPLVYGADSAVVDDINVTLLPRVKRCMLDFFEERIFPFPAKRRSMMMRSFGLQLMPHSIFIKILRTLGGVEDLLQTAGVNKHFRGLLASTFVGLMSFCPAQTQ